MDRFASGLLLASLFSSSVVLADNAQENSKGFVEDSKATALYRNFYFYRNYLNESPQKQNYVKEWAHALMLNYRSGYTQGLVGFGLDAQLYEAQKLDGGAGTGGSGLMPRKPDGDSRSYQNKVNGVLKARISNTEFRYGQQQPLNPVFGYSDSRLLPHSFTGWSLNSKEFANLQIEAGHFTASSAQTQEHHDEELGLAFTNNRMLYTTRSATYAGMIYTPNKASTISLYGLNYENIWNQYYLGYIFNQPINTNLAYDLSFNLYRTLATGERKAGDIDNTTGSLTQGLSYQGHRLALSYQQVWGDEPFDHAGSPGSYGQIWLANINQYQEFNGPNEKSVQLRYSYNFTNLGLPGLTFMTRYTKGWNIDGTHASAAYAGRYGANVKQWERDMDLGYVVQSGSAKGLSFLLRYAVHRTSGVSTLRDLDDVRFITQYPFNLF